MEMTSQFEHDMNYCWSHLKQTAVPLLKVVMRKEKVNFLNVKDFLSELHVQFSAAKCCTFTHFLFSSH